MASPSQLVQSLSKATGVPLVSITDLDRRLSKAGLRATTGRGINAARMTPVDAAHLLTALLASPQANQAAEAVERYGTTQVDPGRSSKGYFGASELADLADLPSKHSFVDGLALLVRLAAVGSLAALARLDDSAVRLEVTTLTRATVGRIRISGLASGKTTSLEYGPATDTRGQTFYAGDLEQSRRITERTIFALAALFTKQKDQL